MVNPASSAVSARYSELSQRIIALRVVLHEAFDPTNRTAILDELGAATQELTELILKQEGKLRSPLEPVVDARRRPRTGAASSSG